MHYLLELSSSANSDLNFWVSKLSKNSVLGVQMTRWAHRRQSPCNQEAASIGIWSKSPIPKSPFAKRPMLKRAQFIGNQLGIVSVYTSVESDKKVLDCVIHH